MGWSTENWTQQNIQLYADEILNAYNERRLAVGDSAITEMADNTNLQYYYIYSQIQNWIKNNCYKFVVSHNEDGTKRGDGYYDNKSSMETWMFFNLMKSVRGESISQPAFRKTDTSLIDWEDWGDDGWQGAVYNYGICEAGDRFGPWIFEDLQKALNRLIWIPFEGAFSVESGNTYSGNSGWIEPGDETDWGDVKSAAEADWDVGRNWTSDPARLSTLSYSSILNAKRAYAYNISKNLDSAGSISTSFKKDVEIYLYSDKDNSIIGTFDNDGESCLIEEKWGLKATQNLDKSDSAIDTVVVGDSTHSFPTWPSSSPPGGGIYDRGFFVRSVFLNVRFDVAGGFNYLEEDSGS